MTTLVIGVNRQLESKLRQAFGDDDLIPLTRAAFEVVDRIQVEEIPDYGATGTVRWSHPILN